MKCLVTGAAGFIGSNLALELEKQGHEVVALDNLSVGVMSNLEGFKGKFVQGDICTWDTDEKFDVIFHEAAITDPRHGSDEQTIYTNLIGWENVLRLARRDKASLIYASTAALYGNGKAPQQEDQEKDLRTAYAHSKMIIDEQTKALLNEMHIVGLRYFNVFGPNEAHKGRPSSMIYHLAKQMKAGIKPKLFKYGEHKRDHIYVKDIVRAKLLALKAPSGIYNVGTGKATSFNELIYHINKALGTSYGIDYIDMPYDPKTYQFHTQADTTRAREVLGFTPAWSLGDAITEYVGMLQ
jgi:ADP-L-glycero-D-manno-heptose 6-epimerase